MTQDRKYLGMTVRQLGILAGLVVLACLIFGVTGSLALRRGLGLFSRAPQSTPVIQPSATSVILPTITPTETVTPIPYEQLIPFGWTQHQTQLMEIWMPPDFKDAAPGVVSASRLWSEAGYDDSFSSPVSVSDPHRSGDCSGRPDSQEGKSRYCQPALLPVFGLEQPGSMVSIHIH